METFEKAKLALKKLHSNGALHGGIASRNIVANASGSIKLIDLGSAYKADDAGSEQAKRIEIGILKEVFELSNKFCEGKENNRFLSMKVSIAFQKIQELNFLNHCILK